MTSAAVLAKLNVKNIRFDVGSGGIPEFTQCDIAAACSMAKLSKGAFYLGLVKYCGRTDAVNSMRLLAWDVPVSLAIKNEWAVPRGKQYLKGLSDLALYEVVSARKCKACLGTALTVVRTECKSCGATGSAKPLTIREMASIAGIPVSSFQNTWKCRYNLVFDTINDWDNSISAGLHWQLNAG